MSIDFMLIINIEHVFTEFDYLLVASKNPLLVGSDCEFRKDVIS